MEYNFNEGQKKVFDAALDWYFNSDDLVFEFSGGPGRGKTWVLNAIIHALQLEEWEIAPMTYTGAAAINMRRKGMVNAKTAHSWLYSAVDVPLMRDGKIVMNYKFNRPVMTKKFVPHPLDPGIKLVVADEGWSIPEPVANEIRKQGVKILVTGDRDQLPPVGAPPGFLRDPNVMRLTENMRQGNTFNGIEYLSQRALRGLPLHVGYYGNAIVLSRSMFLKNMDLYMNNMDIIICSRNATRDDFTRYCRSKRGYQDRKLPVYGEPVVSRENVWDMEVDGINLVNGLRGVVMNMPDASGVNWTQKTFNIDFKPDNMDKAFFNVTGDYNYINLDHTLRNEYKDHETHYKRGILFEYGYAISTYMAQGSEYNNVLYIQESLGGLSTTSDYVGITRARNFLIVVLSDG